MKKKIEKKECKVGDIFSIPLEKNLYGFARIVNIQDGWDLAQLFSYTSDKSEFSPEILESTILQPPFPFTLKDIELGKLSIVVSDPEFVPSELESIEFYMGEKDNFRLIKINEYRPTRKISNEEATLLPRMEFYSLGGMIRRVKEILLNRKKQH